MARALTRRSSAPSCAILSYGSSAMLIHPRPTAPAARPRQDSTRGGGRPVMSVTGRPLPRRVARRKVRSVDLVAVDVVPVDVVAEPWILTDVNVALVVHRVDQLVEPGRRRIVVDERVEQAALIIEAGADHRTEGVQVADSGAV